MKKLNRKGFTLVELLAVIIILAIVVGITIPAVLNTINKSKNNATGVAADTAQRWLEDQALVYNTDTSIANDIFKNDLSTLATSGTTTDQTLSTNAMKEVGLSTANVTVVKAKAMGGGKVCVTIEKIPTTSQYYTTEYWNSDGTAKGTTTKNKSSHCS